AFCNHLLSFLYGFNTFSCLGGCYAGLCRLFFGNTPFNPFTFSEFAKFFSNLSKFFWRKTIKCDRYPPYNTARWNFLNTRDSVQDQRNSISNTVNMFSYIIENE